MEIRCIDGKNSKLVKGQVYNAIYILGDSKLKGSNSNYYNSIVELYNGDKYNSLNRFETLDGKTLETIYIDERTNTKEQELTIHEKNISPKELLKTWIKYNGGNSSKYFVNGNIYKVGEVDDDDYTYYTHSSYRVKIEGFEHFWTNTHSFRLLEKKEIRDLKIDIIDGIEVITNNYTRKLDAITPEEKLKVLMNSLIRARYEFTKNNFKDITIEEFMVDSDNKYGITLDDIEEFKSLKIPDLFK